MIVIPLILFLTLAFDPLAYCYGGGVEHVTTTLSNGNTTTYTLYALPFCGTPPNLIIPFFATLAIGIFLIGFGVKKK